MTVDRIGTVVAGLERGAAGAADRCQGTVERADDLADADVGGWPGERIAAARALLRAQDAGIAQFEQDRVQELFRNIVPRGDLGDEGGLSGLQLSQVDKGLEPVFSFLVNMSLHFPEQGKPPQRPFPRHLPGVTGCDGRTLSLRMSYTPNCTILNKIRQLLHRFSDFRRRFYGRGEFPLP